jgi:prephenate dehydrogenase
MEDGFKRSLRDCRVGIIGLGLMGGSLALALRSHCASISGYDIDSGTIDQAIVRGIIDRPIDFQGDQVDVLIVAAPVSGILDWLARVPAVLSGRFHLIDLGSTKTQIVAAMQSLPDRISPLGGHPMCGKETSGLSVADQNLYRNCLFVLTPLARTHSTTLEIAQDLLNVIEARVLLLDPERHDFLVAAISHVPYLTAVALVDAAQRADDEAAWTLAASGFRDSTRLAASDVTMLLDILMSNRASVLQNLSRVQASLQTLAEAIQRSDRTALHVMLEAARERRSTLFV